MAKQIVIADIKKMLEDGMDRKEIGKLLELNPREYTALWKHPELKGLKRAKYKNELIFVTESTPTSNIDLN